MRQSALVAANTFVGPSARRVASVAGLRLELGVVYDPVDHVPLPHLFGSRRLGKEHHLGGFRAADTLRDLHHAALQSHDADTCFRKCETGGPGGEDQIAAQREFEPTAHASALHCSDGWNRQAFQMVQRLGEHLYLWPQDLRGGAWPVPYIPAKTEVAAFAPDKEGPCRALFDSLNSLP